MPSFHIRQASLLHFLALTSLGFILSSHAHGEIYGVQNRISSPAPNNHQLFLQLNDDSTVVEVEDPTLYLVSAIYGAALLNDTLYGIELDNSGNEFLVTIPTTGQTLGARVTGVHIGFPNIESLAAVEGELFASSISFTNHETTLIKIDPDTGVGTAIGKGSRDHMIVGLTYDPINKILYGSGAPFATVNGHNLFTIDQETGATTLIGPMGAPIRSLAWSDTLGLIGNFDHLYTINETTAVATQVGSTDFTNGVGVGNGLFNGIYALAATPPVPKPSLSFNILSLSQSEDGSNTISWESDTLHNYTLEFSPTLTPPNWTAVSAPLSGVANDMSTTHQPAGGVTTGYYHVVRTLK